MPVVMVTAPTGATLGAVSGVSATLPTVTTTEYDIPALLRFIIRSDNDVTASLWLSPQPAHDGEVPPAFNALLRRLLAEGSLEGVGARGLGGDVPSRVAVTPLGRRRYLQRR